MNKTYRTKDLQLASFLLASGFNQYEPIKEGSIIYFEFETDKDDPKHILEIEETQYWQNNVLIEPKKLFAAYNELRLRIRNMKL